MNDEDIQDIPDVYPKLLQKCDEIGFSMPSDLFVGTLLKTLVASKPGSKILELGTGVGLSLSWMVAGMDSESTLLTVDNDPQLIEVANSFFEKDTRIDIICEDGTVWLKNYEGEQFDLVFADAWPGKYSEIEEVLDMINVGGIYIIDDMTPQSNWPDGHDQKAKALLDYLEKRTDFSITKMNWSTGIVIATKKEVAP